MTDAVMCAIPSGIEIGRIQPRMGVYLEKTDESCFQPIRRLSVPDGRAVEFSVVLSFTDHDNPIDNLMELVVEIRIIFKV